MTKLLVLAFVCSAGLWADQLWQGYQASQAAQEALALAQQGKTLVDLEENEVPLGAAWALLSDENLSELLQDSNENLDGAAGDAGDVSGSIKKYTAGPMDKSAKELNEKGLSALQTVNPEVIGWICVPGTVINYPLLHTDNNEYYLNRTWDRKKSSSGSIFLESQNKADLEQFNTILYGHNMKRGTMFGSLDEYKDNAYRQNHPFVYVMTETEIRRYTIFSAYEASIQGYAYGVAFTSVRQKEIAIEEYLASSIWAAGVRVNKDDSILTLSTCTGKSDYNYRFVVHAVLSAVWER
jgi:sortase B